MPGNLCEKPRFGVGAELVIEAKKFTHWYSVEVPSGEKCLPFSCLTKRPSGVRRNPAIAHLAALSGDADLFRAHPNPAQVALLRDAGGLYPLHYAAYAGNMSSCRALLEMTGGAGNAMKVTSRAGYSALHSAARGGHLELVEMFLSEGATSGAERAALIMMPATRHGYTVLDCAVAADSVDVVNRLLQEPLPSAQSLVLHRALQLDSVEVVRRLLLPGGLAPESPLVADICAGRTLCWPFGEVAHYLELDGRWAVLPEGPMFKVRDKSVYQRLLGKADEDGVSPVLHSRSRDGKTLLHHLLEAGFLSSSKNRCWRRLQETCVVLGADANAVDKRGLSVAHLAALRGPYYVSQAVYQNANLLVPRATPTLASPLQIMIAKVHDITTWDNILRQCKSVEETFEVLTKPFVYEGEWGTPMEWMSRKSDSDPAEGLKQYLLKFGIPVDAGSVPGDEWLVPELSDRPPSWVRRLPHPVVSAPVTRMSWTTSAAIDGPAIELVRDGASAHANNCPMWYQAARRCPFEQLSPLLLAFVLQRDASAIVHDALV